MQICIKYNSDSNLIGLESADLISDLLQKAANAFDLPADSFNLSFGNILLEASHPISFYNLQDSSQIDLTLKSSSPGFQRSTKKKRTYLDSIGLSEDLPSRNSNPLNEAIGACKRGSLREISKVIEIFEQTNPGEEDLMNQCHPNLWTPLHYACFYGHTEIVRYLITRNVNVNKVTLDEWTPLQLACYCSHTECVAELVNYTNLQINKMTRYRGTGLHLACENEMVEIIKLLLTHGAKADLTDPQGLKPTEITFNAEILEMIESLSAQLRKSYIIPTSKFCEVFICNTLSIHGRSVVIFLDPDNLVLLRFSSLTEFEQRIEPEFSLKLQDIQNVIYEENSKTKEFYFIVESGHSSDRYFTNDPELTKDWIASLKNAANYFMNSAPLKERATVRMEKVVLKEEEENHTVNTAEVINFDSFELLCELGHGSFGVVYKVEKKSSKEIFAMKCLSKPDLKKQRQLKYAISECKIMKILKHPFVLTMQYAFQTTQSLFMVLEYCPNGDLLGLIEKHTRVPEELACFYIAEVLLAIEYLHSLDILYRDLKPANVLIDCEFHAKLADFGLAKEDITNTPAMTMAGSPAYLPPEIVDRRGASTASDIYGIGVMLYELLTGNLPYYNQDIEVLFNSIKNNSISFPKFLSKDAKDLIKALMLKAPEKRLKIPQIKKHPFFRAINWESLQNRTAAVPVILS